MQFRLMSALLVFLGSYFPLAVILALQDIKQEYWRLDFCWHFRDCVLPIGNHPYLAIFGVLMTLSCLLLTICVLRRLRYKYTIIITTSKPIPSELISYSFPYIVSFMGVDYGSAGKVAGLFVFLIWLFLITYRSGNIIMNPVLLIFGWNLYEAEATINGHKRVVRMLSKVVPKPGKYLCQDIQGSYISVEETQE